MEDEAAAFRCDEDIGVEVGEGAEAAPVPERPCVIVFLQPSNEVLAGIGDGEER